MDALESCFSLPSACRVDETVTKASLLRQEDITTSEKKLLNIPVVRKIKIFGVVRQANSNINSFEDKEESYLEVYFLQLILETSVFEKIYKPVCRILHKLIPHHCIILVTSEDREKQRISLFTKRISGNSPDLRVLSEEIISDPINEESDKAFLSALSFSKAHKTDLKNFYAYYAAAVRNYNLLPLLGVYAVRPFALTEKLDKLRQQGESLSSEIGTLAGELKKTVQMNEKVKLNTEINQLKEQKKTIEQKILSDGKT